MVRKISRGRPKKLKRALAAKAKTLMGKTEERVNMAEKFKDDPTTEVLEKKPRFGFSEQKPVGQEKPAQDYPLSKAQLLAAETADDAEEE